MRPDRPHLRAVSRRAAVRAGEARSRAPGRRRRARLGRRLVRRLPTGTHAPVARATSRCSRRSPAWTIHVPGHPDEVDALLTEAIAGDGNVYVRLSAESNAEAHGDGSLRVVRVGRGRASPVVLAVGPSSSPCSRPRPTSTSRSRTPPPCARSRRAELRARSPEPTSSRRAVPRRHVQRGGLDALVDRPRRLLSIGSPSRSCAATEHPPSTAGHTVSTPGESGAARRLSRGRGR